MTDRLLRDALTQLAMDAPDQRAALAGAVVTDELALDLEHAVASLPAAAVPTEVSRALSDLLDELGAPPEDPLWADASLDTHPVPADSAPPAGRALTAPPRSPLCDAAPRPSVATSATGES